jgi:DnaJ-class molecular chaperone
VGIALEGKEGRNMVGKGVLEELREAAWANDGRESDDAKRADDVIDRYETDPQRSLRAAISLSANEAWRAFRATAIEYLTATMRTKTAGVMSRAHKKCVACNGSGRCQVSGCIGGNYRGMAPCTRCTASGCPGECNICWGTGHVEAII